MVRDGARRPLDLLVETDLADAAKSAASSRDVSVSAFTAWAVTAYLAAPAVVPMKRVGARRRLVVRLPAATYRALGERAAAQGVSVRLLVEAALSQVTAAPAARGPQWDPNRSPGPGAPHG